MRISPCRPRVPHNVLFLSPTPSTPPPHISRRILVLRSFPPPLVPTTHAYVSSEVLVCVHVRYKFDITIYTSDFLCRVRGKTISHPIGSGHPRETIFFHSIPAAVSLLPSSAPARRPSLGPRKYYYYHMIVRTATVYTRYTFPIFYREPCPFVMGKRPVASQRFRRCVLSLLYIILHTHCIVYGSGATGGR